MPNVILPGRLSCPFPSLINIHVNDADEHTLQWLERFRLVDSPAQLHHYHQQGFAWMVARMFPNAEYRTLCAFTDLNTLLFLLDDYFDHAGDGPSAQRDIAVSGMIRDFIRVLFEPAFGKGAGSPVLRALAELWERIATFTSREWRAQFIRSIVAIFRAATWQHENVKAGKWPTMKDYVQRRQYLGAANIATDTIVVANRLRLPSTILKLPVVAELTALCRNTVCWANDLFSLSKEQAHGDYHNLVALLAYEKDLSMEAAVEEACHVHDRQVRRFIRLARCLPALGPLKSELILYVDGLKHIMRANIDWSDYETSRYQYDYAPDMLSAVQRPHYLMEALGEFVPG